MSIGLAVITLTALLKTEMVVLKPAVLSGVLSTVTNNSNFSATLYTEIEIIRFRPLQQGTADVIWRIAGEDKKRTHFYPECDGFLSYEENGPLYTELEVLGFNMYSAPPVIDDICKGQR